MEGSPGGLGVAEAPGWTLGVVDFSGEALGRLNMCHHPDVIKFRPLQMPPASSLSRVCGREVGEAKILRWIINVLKLIMMLASREVCDKSL